MNTGRVYCPGTQLGTEIQWYSTTDVLKHFFNLKKWTPLDSNGSDMNSKYSPDILCEKANFIYLSQAYNV